MVQIIQCDRNDLESVCGELFKKALQEVQNLPKEKPLPDRMSTDEALIFLKEQGRPIKKSQLYKETSLNSIPSTRLGKRCVFSRKILTEWINAGMPNYANEIAAQSLAVKLKNR
jgi:hypothetical protein